MSVTLPDICQGLAAVLSATPGVAAAYGVPPNQIGSTLPAVVVFSEPEVASEIQSSMGSLMVWKHRLLARCYVKTVKNLEADLGLALPLPEAMVATLMATNGLGLGPEFMGANVLTYRIGVAGYGGTDHVIAEVALEARAKYEMEITR